MTLPYSQNLDGQILLYSDDGVVVCLIGAHTVEESREAFEAWMGYRNMMARSYAKAVSQTDVFNARRRWERIRDMFQDRQSLSPEEDV